jgi:hypothetical protein
LAGLTPADQDELNRILPPECADKHVVVLSDWSRVRSPLTLWSMRPPTRGQ